jgi:hypothetical protein
MSLSITSQGDWLSPGGAASPVVIVTTAVPGTYVFHVDRSNQIASDVINIILKQAVRNVGDGATAAVAEFRTITNAPDDEDNTNLSNVRVPAYGIDCPYGLSVELEQTAGVAAVYPWSLVRVG